MVTQDALLAQSLSDEQRVSQLVNSGPLGPAMPK
jgi:hypothetical protein